MMKVQCCACCTKDRRLMKSAVHSAAADLPSSCIIMAPPVALPTRRCEDSHDCATTPTATATAAAALLRQKPLFQLFCPAPHTLTCTASRRVSCSELRAAAAGVWAQGCDWEVTVCTRTPWCGSRCFRPVGVWLSSGSPGRGASLTTGWRGVCGSPGQGAEVTRPSKSASEAASLGRSLGTVPLR